MSINLGRNVFNISTYDLIGTILSYVFWISIAFFTDSITIGAIGVIISFVIIAGVIIPLGIDFSLMKKIGEFLGNKKIENAYTVIRTSSLVSIVLIIPSSVILLIFANTLPEIFGLTEEFLQYSVLILVVYYFHGIFRNSIIAIQQKTVTLVYAEILSHIVKFIVTFSLIFIGFEIFAVVLGFFFHFLVKALIFGKVIFKISGNPRISEFKEQKDVQIKLIKEGMVIWVPTVISSLGNSLGTIIVGSGNNLSSAGIYFVAFMIYIVLLKIPSQIQIALFPVFSGLKESTNILLEKSLIISLIVIMPFTSMVMFYPQIFLQMFGADFVKGEEIVFLFSTVVFVDLITSSIGMLKYSKGNFKEYAVIIVPFSLSKIILYFVLVPISGEVGAVQAWIIGSVIGFITTLFVMFRTKININWKIISFTAIIPIGIGVICEIFIIHFIPAFFIIFIVSWILYLKFKILQREEIEYMIKSLLPEEKSKNLVKQIFRILDKIRL